MMRYYDSLAKQPHNQKKRLIKRAAIVGRLYYHTAQCLLAQLHPVAPPHGPDMRTAQLHHAHQVCGIVAHTADRGVASVSIRSLALVAEVLDKPREQHEVVAILERIDRDTGWKLAAVLAGLRRAWGWTAAENSQTAGNTTMAGTAAMTTQAQAQAQSQGQGQGQGQRYGQSQGQVQGPTPPAVGMGRNSSGGLAAQWLPRAGGGDDSSLGGGYGRSHSHSHGHGNGIGAGSKQMGPLLHSQTTTPPSRLPQNHHSSLMPVPQQQRQHQHQHQHQRQHQQQQQHPQHQQRQQQPANLAAPRPLRVNPLSFADFSLPNHPYQNWYEPPSRSNSYNLQQGFP